jgi:uncharacterized membrane protein YidH (DUF202 family)
MRNILGDFFRLLSDVVNGAERSFLDFLSALVPYFVPVIPAYLTYFHTETQMNFPPWVAATAAFVVEVLGITAVSTAIKFWRHNKHYKDDKNKAPFWLAVAVYAFYILVVISVNVILEIVAGTRGGWVILSIALFSLLSVPSGVLISIRTQFGEMLEDIGSRYKKPNAPPAYAPAPQGGTYREKHASDYRDRIVSMLDTEWDRSHQVLTPKQITERLKLNHANNKGYVSNLINKDWKPGKGIQ